MGWKHRLIGAGFAACRAPGLTRIVGRRAQGLGAILMFHHVRPWRERAYAPNRELEVTPGFLDETLRLLARRGWIIVSLDEAVERVRAGGGDRPFAALTFDDGYRDNEEWALPILAREKAPATFFATTGFMNRSARLWWLEVEEAVRRARAIEVEIGGVPITLSCASDPEKEKAAEKLLALLRASPQDEVDRVVGDLSRRHGVDGAALVEELCLDKKEIAALSAHPLLAIGAHTRGHPMLATISRERAFDEIAGGKADLEALTGKPIRHLAYPVGDPGSAGAREFAMAREAGYEAAVTTRPGMLFPEHAAHITALPRLSVNGRFQSIANLDALLTGLPFALWNRGRRVSA
ncbi:MAG: polysaccharide deacetylase family protein [Rhizobiales bacterium]|nr:polysaccharide deacetylase family protein [Hyphomicrobiales bacterium]